VARAERGVAGADDGEVPVEDALAVEDAAGDDVGGPGERVDGEQTVGGGGGKEFGVGRWDEELGFVEAVEGLAVEGDNADTEFGLIEGWISKDGGDAVGERTFGGRCVGCGARDRVMRRGRVRRGLREEWGWKECNREKEKAKSPREKHDRKCTS
jgi:hypothetical protein